MKKIFNLYTILGIAFMFLFVLLIILLNFDKAIITDNNKEVGLSSINKLINYQENDRYNSISTIMLIMSIVFIGAIALYGLYQLIKFRSLFKIDIDIIVIGIFVIIAIIIWLLFDKVVKINYRPVGEVEGSFPSTHIMVVTFGALIAHHQVCKFKPDSNAFKYLSLLIALIMIVIIFLGRIFAGKHYLTDAIGGVLIGLGLYFLCYGIINYLINKKAENKAKNSEL